MDVDCNMHIYTIFAVIIKLNAFKNVEAQVCFCYLWQVSAARQIHLALTTQTLLCCHTHKSAEVHTKYKFTKLPKIAKLHKYENYYPKFRYATT